MNNNKVSGVDAIKFTIFNCKIKIDFLFVAVLTFITITDKTLLSLCAVCLIFAHEIGHIVSARILKVPVSEINFGAMSIDIEKPQIYCQKSFDQKIIITLSGFIFNLFIFIILSWVYIITKSEIIILIAFQSLIIGTINILPIESLDGGEAVNLILSRFFSYEKAKKISSVLSIVFLVPVIVLGFFLIAKSWRNMSVVMLAVYLIFEKYFV